MSAPVKKPLPPPTKQAPVPPTKAAPAAPKRVPVTSSTQAPAVTAATASASPTKVASPSPARPLPSPSPRALPKVPSGANSSSASPRSPRVPDSLRSRLPPAPPPKAPSDLAAGRGRGRGRGAPPTEGANRRRMPTLRPSAQRPVFSASDLAMDAAPPTQSAPTKPAVTKPVAPQKIVAAILCPTCGHESSGDAFCAECGSPMQNTAAAAVAATSPSSAIDSVLAEAEAHLKQKKICVECYEEGYDAFCSQCGGKMINCDDDDEDVLTADDDESLVASVAPPPTTASGMSALNRLEQALSKPITTNAAATGAAATTTTPASASTPVVAAAVVSKPVVDNDPGYKERVFIVDMGTEYTKFGWSNDSDATRIKSFVDTRANKATNHYTVKGMLFPFDGTDSAFSGNEYLGDLVRKIAKTGNFNCDAPMVLVTCVENHLEGIGEWIYSWAEGEVLSRMPPLLYLGYAPVLSLMSTAGHVFPTGIVVDIGASGVRVVPVYAGSKIDHAIQQHTFGGRMFQELLMQRAPQLGRDESALAAIARDACFCSANFTEEMQRNGYEAAAIVAGQTWRGWKQKNSKLEQQVTCGDGSISMGIESFACCEVFFQPHLVQRYEQNASLPNMVRSAVSFCPRAMQGQLLQQVVVTGDASRIRGLTDRLARELRAIYPTMGNALCVVQAPSNSAWKGAKLIASRSHFPSMCTSLNDMQALSSLGHRFF